MVTRSKLRDEVIDALLARIAADGLESGDRLPPERELSAQLGVSRTVVREGLTALEMRGLLELVPGRRPVLVRRFGPAFAATLGSALAADDSRLPELMEVRVMVEPEAAALAAVRATEAQVAALEDAVALMEEHIDDDLGRVDADIAFHEALVDASGNRLLAEMMGSAAGLLALSRRRTVGARRPPSSALAEHRAIVEAIRAGDADAARAACSAHLASTALDIRSAGPSVLTD